MDDFEKAVLYSFDPQTDPALKARAIEYCNQVKDAPDGWRFCLDRFTKTNTPHVKFFCLQVLQDIILHRYAGLQPDDKNLLKSTLYQWFQLTGESSAYIKNKFAQTFILLFKAECGGSPNWKDEWQAIMLEILKLCTTPAVFDLFLRLLVTIDQEVVSSDVCRSPADIAHNAQIKDYIRERWIRSIVEAWRAVLLTYHQTMPELADMCLACIKSYIAWIDINLIANEAFLPLFYGFLSNNRLAENSCECLYEIVTKGMEPAAKLMLLDSLRILSVLGDVKTDNIEVMEKLAKLVNALGVELLACWDEVQKSGDQAKLAVVQQMTEQALQYLFVYMNNEDDDVSSITLLFAQGYLNKLKQRQLSERQTEHLQLFLKSITNKFKYKESFDFDHEEESEAEFMKFRQALGTFFKNITRSWPALATGYVQSLMVAVCTANPPPHFTDVEVAINLFQMIHEGLGEDLMKSADAFFSQLMVLLIDSKISLISHPSVACMYMEVIVKYAKYIPSAPPEVSARCLTAVLSFFLDQRGIRSNHKKIRRRSCYMLSRLVKAVTERLVPFLNEIIKNLEKILAVSFEIYAIYPAEDQQYLYTAVGALINAVPLNDQLPYVQAIVSPLIAQVEEISSKQLYKTDTPDKPVYTTLLCYLITNVVHFSRGFISPCTSSGQLDLYKRTLTHAVNLLASVHNPDYRTKVIFLLHRMVEVMGAEIFPFLPVALTHLMTSCNTKELVEFLRLTNQLISKFKEHFIPVLNESFVTIKEKAFACLGQTFSPNSEEERELKEVQKMYYLFLQTIASNNLAGVFTTPNNLPHLEQMLGCIIHGCDDPDYNTQKSCLSTLQRLVRQWGEPGKMDGFYQFVFQTVVPTLFKILMKPSVNLEDNSSNQVLTEVVNVQLEIFAKYKKEFLDFLGNIYLPSLGVHPQIVQQYLTMLQSDPKLFKNFFKDFIRSRRA